MCFKFQARIFVPGFYVQNFGSRRSVKEVVLYPLTDCKRTLQHDQQLPINQPGFHGSHGSGFVFEIASKLLGFWV